jgi:hypothetical protein
MIEIPGNETISLQDAIAIDFYLDNINIIFNKTAINSDENYVENAALLATVAYHIADIFCKTKDQINESKED